MLDALGCMQDLTAKLEKTAIRALKAPVEEIQCVSLAKLAVHSCCPTALARVHCMIGGRLQ